MEESGIQKDSSSWIFFVKTTFVCAVMAMAIGIFFLPCVLWVKGYMAMGTLFTIGASITLSKTLRDEHESKKIINRINDVKTEKILKEYRGDM
jgi:hypothetical protein